MHSHHYNYLPKHISALHINVLTIRVRLGILDLPVDQLLVAGADQVGLSYVLGQREDDDFLQAV